MVFPMASLTYATDVAPHLQRALIYRRQRIQRFHALYAREGYNDDDYDPYAWVKTDSGIRLLMEALVILCSAAGDSISGWLRLGRLQSVMKH
jgi:hypothetical protein